MKNIMNKLEIFSLTVLMCIGLTNCNAVKNANNKQKGGVIGATSGAVGTPSTTGSETVTLAGGNTITLTSGYANPELKFDSGNIIYTENRKPIQRVSDQTEDIKIIIEF